MLIVNPAAVAVDALKRVVLLLIVLLLMLLLILLLPSDVPVSFAADVVCTFTFVVIIATAGILNVIDPVVFAMSVALTVMLAITLVLIFCFSTDLLPIFFYSQATDSLPDSPRGMSRRRITYPLHSTLHKRWLVRAPPVYGEHARMLVCGSIWLRVTTNKNVFQQ